MIMLSSIVVLSNILYIRTKMIKDAGDSVTAFYAADSGIEKFLYAKGKGWALLPFDPPDAVNYYLMEGPELFSQGDSKMSYGYKESYTPGGPSIARTLVAVGKYAKIKRGIIVKW
jgi:hypothetical protein